MSGELERFEPGEQRGRIAYEHLHRYSICCDYAGGRRVLDLACGTGYGTNLLAQAAAKAVGIDIDADAIRAATKRYKRKNLRYMVGDCFDLPFDDKSFDIVVANEMIEHVHDQEKLVSEAKRVLVPGGLLLVSTPNKPVYNRYKEPNKFHVSELDIPEFRRLLEDHFKTVQFVGLRMALVSAGYSLANGYQGSNLAAAKLYRGILRDTQRPDVVNEELQFNDPEYVLAICSDEPIEESPNTSSIFFSREDDLWSEHEKVMAWASQLHQEDEGLRSDLANAKDEAQKIADALQRTESEKGDLQARLEQSEARGSSGGAAEHLGTPARLLGRLTGTQVEADQGSVIESLFSLNEQLTLQRTRLDELDSAVARAEALEQELAQLRERLSQESDRARVFSQQSDRLQQELQRSREMLAESERRAKQLEAQSNEGAETLSRTQQQLSDALAMSERFKQDLAASKASLDDARSRATSLEAQSNTDAETLSRTKQQLSDALAASEKFKSELADSQARLSEALDRATSLEASIESLTSDDSKKLDLESNDHGLIREELTTLKAALGKVEPDPPASTQHVPAGARPRKQDPAEAVAAALSRRRTRFQSTHRRVSSQIAAASSTIRNKVAPAPAPAKKNWVARLAPSAGLSTVLFDPQWIREQDPDIGKVSLRAYLKDPGLHRQIDPHPLFAAAWYLDRNPDVAETGVAPLTHYLEHGWREGRAPHPYFANDWYLAQNPDVLEAGLNPLEHYLTNGWKEGRWPNPLFDPRRYLDHYPDVDEAGTEPLTHYVAYGRAEDREIHSAMFGKEWRTLVPGSESATLMDHLLGKPAPAQADPAPGFDGRSVASGWGITARGDAPTGQSEWPPEPIGDYWLAQQLRDLIIAQNGETAVDLYWYLCSVMAAYADRPGDFPDSEECAQIMRRLQQQSAERSRNQRGPLEATIIIPVFNNFLDTLLCLASVLELDTQARYEIIVADDRSDDCTEQMIPQIGGVVRHLRHPQNHGFLGNCNLAAEEARGSTIVLLNNDTLVMPGWLEGLLAPFSNDGVGLVGSKLINWDGTLQEAGGIFWEDGSAWNFGRGGDPLAPEFNYLKDVDYCSGASIAVPRAVWRELGGFDQVYSPAYCEDSDLAFRLRAAGYRTLYNPQSEVIHHEGRSHGRDVSSGGKAYQLRNQERLVERWRDVLSEQNFPNGQDVLRARDRSRNKPHILIIDHYVPKWDQDAGSRTMYQFIRMLVAEGWAVSFWPDNLHLDPIYGPALQELGVELLYGYEYVDRFAEFLDERRGLYDAVLLSRPHIAPNYLDALREKSDARLLYYGHDLHFTRMAAQRALGDTSVGEEDIESMKRDEVAICSACDVVLYPSTEEAEVIAGLVPPDVICRPIPAYSYSKQELDQAQSAIAKRQPPSGLARLLFVGGFSHTPNIDSVQWFCDEIAPILRDRSFAFHLDIVGSQPPPEVRALAGDDVSVLGFVSDEDLAELYRKASAVIAPLRYGAGVKGKVVEALANGVPVATTAVGAQGLPGADEFLVCGDSAEAFADAIGAACDPQQWKVRARAGIDYVRKQFSAEAIRSVLRSVLPAPADSGR